VGILGVVLVLLSVVVFVLVSSVVLRPESVDLRLPSVILPRRKRSRTIQTPPHPTAAPPTRNNHTPRCRRVGAGDVVTGAAHVGGIAGGGVVVAGIVEVGARWGGGARMVRGS
jgi:hypothetical protein